MRTRFLSYVVLACLTALTHFSVASAKELFDGQSLAGWQGHLDSDTAKTADVWSVRDGVLVCKGTPLGYLRTTEKYTNFQLKLDWRWAVDDESDAGRKANAKTPNSGVLLRITGDPIGFMPRCAEAQLQSGSAGDIWAFRGFPLTPGQDRIREVKDHAVLGDFSGVAAMAKAEKELGQWNSYDITMNDGKLTVKINGQLVNEATGLEVVSGYIGLQSEGAEIHFRNIEVTPLNEEPSEDWISLFDGKSFDGWKVNENRGTWSVQDGCLVTEGPRSHLFYEGPVAKHDFKNFEYQLQVKTRPGSNSGVYFHTKYQAEGFPGNGYEVQVHNTNRRDGRYRELKLTGSLYGIRNIYHSFAKDNQWFSMRVKVIGNRVQVWVNDYPTVDYLIPEDSRRGLQTGTFALQGHDPTSWVAYRDIKVRVLPDDATVESRASTDGYGIDPRVIDRTSRADIPLIDYHVHLRGGMTVEKAMDRQAVTGFNVGVLRNLGKGWPIENDEQLETFINRVDDRPVFIGLQVNDRDWYTEHSQELIGRLDFILADTMIMPMPNDDSEPVKLFVPEAFQIDDPQAWMDRYVAHNLKVLAEPITILANPTWLPEVVADQYDALWTDERMEKVIRAAVDNHVALEINAGSGYPHDAFIRKAKAMGAKFSFGSNNFDDKPHDMTRCIDAVKKYELKHSDMRVPEVIAGQ
ncbi:hypothetical protein CA13_05770 [Planctomycetes bacterium CA13]|uniref:3-keto-alpha-glucoside-1,2-lyase/3-keto-2-hydroxy-glucal hydratase domain-containing protein n=1 Tax=Novipirellula herctigrandis TaxID=2527986 RepID=A0A5C5YVT3_9BACT|nr:hypothetical protein CA13_05770 [Planctomycetes bacterium CA13]